MFVLETKRLILRQYKDEDITSLHSIFSDPESMKFYPAPFSIKQTQDWIRREKSRA
jgi:[ribosomal protein S5]-alanine N-acetyltransferase